MRRVSLFLSLAALVLLAGGCGGDNLNLCNGCATLTATPTTTPETSTPTPTPTTQPFGAATLPAATPAM